MSNSLQKMTAGSFLILDGKKSENQWQREFTNWKKGISDMSEDTKEGFIKWGDWIYRAIILTGLIILMFMNSRYTTKEEFLDQTKRIDTMEKVLIKMETYFEVQKRIESILADHETRIRQIERTQK